MSKRLDLVGRRFERLKVVAFAGTREDARGRRRSTWTCACDCGAEHVADGTALKLGMVKSCGCLRRETAPANAARARRGSAASARAQRRNAVVARVFGEVPTLEPMDDAVDDAREYAGAFGVRP